MKNKLENIQIVVVGLGYVGLPLVIEFSRKHDTIGYDMNGAKIAALKSGISPISEILDEDIINVKLYTSLEKNNLKSSKRSIFIVTVPTPINSFKEPDLEPLKSASVRYRKCFKER